MSYVTITNAGHPYYEVEADGGTRRERAGAISAAIRGRGFKRTGHPRYSETYGFQTRTTIRYVIA